jgi:hypothetical protein
MSKWKETEMVIDNYLRNNLTIEATKIYDTYGNPNYTQIELLLNGEVISTTYIDV